MYLSYITVECFAQLLENLFSEEGVEEFMFKSLNQLNVFPYMSFYHLGIKHPVLAGK